MMTILQQQCLLTALGYYKLKRQDGSPAIDGLGGPATRQAIYNFQLQHRKRSEFITLDTDGVWGPDTEEAIRDVIGSQEPPQLPDPPAKDQPTWWSKYPAVSRESWRCQCGGRYCSGWPAEPHEKTVALLQQFADHFGKPIRRHSGLRCTRWNALWGGANGSKHCFGMAYDFHIDGVSPQALADYAETLMPDWGGIGIYSWGIHIDDRPVKGRWHG